MNNQRRKKLNNIKEEVERLQYEVTYILSEEEESFDNLPESLQYSERGEAMQEAIEQLEEINNCMDELIGQIYEICG